MRSSWIALIPLFMLIACDKSPSSRIDPGERLHALFEDAWAFELRENPLRTTSVGHHENDHLLPSVSTEDETRRAEARGGFLERLRTIDRSQLAPADRISYDMFERELADALSEFVFQSFQVPINADSGFHIAFSRLPSRMPFQTTTDYENYDVELGVVGCGSKPLLLCFVECSLHDFGTLPQKFDTVRARARDLSYPRPCLLLCFDRCLLPLPEERVDG